MAELENGIARFQSTHSVDATVERMVAALKEKGITLFALVDHSGEAAKAGLEMPPTKLLIFGNPKAGTPVMLAAPSAALDLPLKILVAEEGDGSVWISTNRASYLQTRHGFSNAFLVKLSVAEMLAEMISK